MRREAQLISTEGRWNKRKNGTRADDIFWAWLVSKFMDKDAKTGRRRDASIDDDRLLNLKEKEGGKYIEIS